MIPRTIRMTVFVLAIAGSMALIGSVLSGAAAYVTAAVVLFFLIAIVGPVAFGRIAIRPRQDHVSRSARVRVGH